MRGEKLIIINKNEKTENEKARKCSSADIQSGERRAQPTLQDELSAPPPSPAIPADALLYPTVPCTNSSSDQLTITTTALKITL